MFELREGRLSDAAALAELSGQLGYPARPEQVEGRLREILGRSDHCVLVAEKDAQVIGWIHIFGRIELEMEAYAEIGGLVVDKEHRSQGAGEILLNAAEAWAARRGYHQVRVRSNVIRTRAHGFYERQGYSRSKNQIVLDKRLW